MAHKAVSNFKYGFSIKGFNANEVGTDVIQTYKSKSTWNKDEDGEKDCGTPIKIDYENGRELKVCPDGEVPHGFLEISVSKELTDYEMMLNLYPVNEVRAGDPVAFIKFKEYAILETSLFADGYTPDVGDKVYVSGGKFDGSDPLDGSGKSIGTIVETGVETGYSEILLEKE